MRRQTVEAILAKIDAAVGPPDTETDAEHDKRIAMVERDARARQIRRESK
jgi:phage anti-repressor protein